MEGRMKVKVKVKKENLLTGQPQEPHTRRECRAHLRDDDAAGDYDLCQLHPRLLPNSASIADRITPRLVGADDRPCRQRSNKLARIGKVRRWREGDEGRDGGEVVEENRVGDGAFEVADLLCYDFEDRYGYRDVHLLNTKSVGRQRVCPPRNETETHDT